MALRGFVKGTKQSSRVPPQHQRPTVNLTQEEGLGKRQDGQERVGRSGLSATHTASTPPTGGARNGAPAHGPTDQEPLPDLATAMKATRGIKTTVLKCMCPQGQILCAYNGELYPLDEYAENERKAEKAAAKAQTRATTGAWVEEEEVVVGAGTARAAFHAGEGRFGGCAGQVSAGVGSCRCGLRL